MRFPASHQKLPDPRVTTCRQNVAVLETALVLASHNRRFFAPTEGTAVATSGSGLDNHFAKEH